jgi:Ser/Thr protein kinase RdoA (MazF antagonist)
MGLVPVPPDWPPLRTEEVCRLLARLVGLDDASAARITWHSPRPFAATAIISVPGTGGDEPRRLVVKRHHRAVRTRTSLQAEHAFMAHLAARGVAVPRALDDGARSAWAEDDFVYEVLELLDGHDLYREARSWTPFTSVGHAQAAGRALARLHLASQTYAAPARPHEPLRASAEIVSCAEPVAAVAALAEQRPGLAGFLRHRPWRRELANSLGPLHARFLPHADALAPLWAHNDWHPSNLLWSGPGAGAQVTGVIDFGLSNLTTACYELATAIERSAIGWLGPADRRTVRPDLVKALLGGYSSLRPLGPEERAALPHLLPVVHVDYALSEVEYFHAVARSPANAMLAYRDYLFGHLEWFAGPEGTALCSYVEQVVNAGRRPNGRAAPAGRPSSAVRPGARSRAPLPPPSRSG